MDNNKIDIKAIKVKRPFKRVVTREGVNVMEFMTGYEPCYDPGVNKFVTVTQADFLEEYYPGGHRIYDRTYFPDIYRNVEESTTDDEGNEVYDNAGNAITKGQVYCEQVPRYAFAFQQMIAMAHITHATGNDVQHELSVDDPTEAQEKLFDSMCGEWIHAGMERAWYESFKSREITAEAAFVGYMDEKKNFSWRVFSYKNGDLLYPHYDRYGKMTHFARITEQYDDRDQQVAETIEIWDKDKFYVYRRNTGENRSFLERLKDEFGLENYVLLESGTHGFGFIPVAYVRDDDGPGWTASQDAIDCYELSFSQMAHNNQAYGEAILVLKSQADIPAGITRDISGTVKEIDLQGENDEAKFLEGQSAADSYIKQLDTLEDSIYRSSNAVKVPSDLKSGDTPASAIKLLFANALNQAAADGMECEEFVNDMWKIFAYAYGLKNKCLVDANAIPVHSWIKPYIHLSESAITADLVALKNAGILSAQTSQERASFYSKPGEMRRIQNESKEKQDLDLLYEQEALKQQTDATIKTTKATASLNKQNQSSSSSNNNSADSGK